MVNTRARQDDPLPPLLRLPGELRNRIYEWVAFIEEARVDITSKTTIRPSGLSYSCKLIKEEFEQLYLDTALQCAHKVDITCTKTFAFGPKDRLVACLKALRDSPRVAQRRIVVRLHTCRAADDSEYDIVFYALSALAKDLYPNSLPMFDLEIPWQSAGNLCEGAGHGRVQLQRYTIATNWAYTNIRGSQPHLDRYMRFWEAIHQAENESHRRARISKNGQEQQ